MKRLRHSAHVIGEAEPEKGIIGMVTRGVSVNIAVGLLVDLNRIQAFGVEKEKMLRCVWNNEETQEIARMDYDYRSLFPVRSEASTTLNI